MVVTCQRRDTRTDKARSVFLKWTAPRKAGSGFPNGSTAATFRSNTMPDVAFAGAVNFKRAAAAAIVTIPVPVSALGPAITFVG